MIPHVTHRAHVQALETAIPGEACVNTVPSSLYFQRISFWIRPCALWHVWVRYLFTSVLICSSDLLPGEVDRTRGWRFMMRKG